MNTIDDITSFIFVENMPQNADIIFIPGGSWPEPTERAAALWTEGFAPYLLPSGRYSPKRGFFPGAMTKPEKYNGEYNTEWEFLFDVLIKGGVPAKAILREDRAEDTLQNAFYSRKVTDEQGLKIRRAIICCKAFHARRSLMSYSWAFPEVEFFVCPAETQNTSRDNWYTTSQGIDRVMGEMARCGLYFKEAISVWSQF